MYENTFKYIQYWLLMDTAVQMTHANRNQRARDIVRYINIQMRTKDDDVPLGKSDDIPF